MIILFIDFITVKIIISSELPFRAIRLKIYGSFFQLLAGEEVMEAEGVL